MRAQGYRGWSAFKVVVITAGLTACATPVPQIDRGRISFSDAVMATAVVQPIHGGGVSGYSPSSRWGTGTT